MSEFSPGSGPVTAAIVCEYNPFHNGHAKQFRQIRRAFGEQTNLVCLMSGNFVQRGEPALFSKTVRAAAAVECGANLVLELPVSCALASAEGFAGGAVQILDRLQGVDVLCFGSETGELDPLWQTAQVLRSEAFSRQLRLELEQKVSFATARSRALQRLQGFDAPVAQPNDILGVEYCKALQQLQSTIRPATFLRRGDYHAAAPEAANPSASSLRGIAPEQWADYVPAAAASLFAAARRYRMAYGERAMLAVLRRLPDEAFAQVPYGSEGLWRRFRRACRQEPSVEAIMDAVKSKRYARSRIARMCMCAYLGLEAEQMGVPSDYVRVLAFDGQGRALLRQLHERSRIPILHGDERARSSYDALERRCQSLYELFADPTGPADALETGRVYYKK